MKKSQQKKVQWLLPDTYQAVIRNSAGTRQFRSAYALVNGKKRDILEVGKLSCAFFVSALLHQLKLIHEVHTTVPGTVRDLRQSGWRKIRKPKPGAVLRWAPVQSTDGHFHEHLGFFLGANRAVSNNSTRGCPTVHHWTFGRKRNRPIRPVIAIYWHSRLSK